MCHIQTSALPDSTLQGTHDVRVTFAVDVAADSYSTTKPSVETSVDSIELGREMVFGFVAADVAGAGVVDASIGVAGVAVADVADAGVLVADVGCAGVAAADVGVAGVGIAVVVGAGVPVAVVAIAGVVVTRVE